MSQHQHRGYSDSTARPRPVALAWSQEFTTREEAISAEQRLKGWTRAKKLALIDDGWARISWLAIPPKERPSTSLRTNGDKDILPHGHPVPPAGREP